jgi:DNA ligase 1
MTDEAFAKKEKEFAERLEEGAETIQYWIYDCPKIGNVTERAMFSLRFLTLQNILQGSTITHDCIKLVPTAEVETQKALDGLYNEYLRDGFEGQMVRRDMSYEQKRSTFLLKRKEFQDAEYKVIDIHEGNGNRQGTAKHLVLFDGKLRQEFHSNIKGNFEYLAEILNNKDEYIGKMATIKFFEYTPDGIPRFPYAIGFRDYE